MSCTTRPFNVGLVQKARSYLNLSNANSTEQSQTCLPLPYASSPFRSLLHPIAHGQPPYSICPTYDDRWDFRTRTFGCHISTLTVFACFVTVICTLLGLLIVSGVVRTGACIWRTYGRSSGWEVSIDDSGSRTGQSWHISLADRLGSIIGRRRRNSGLVQERRRLMQRG